jgi:hypothetical protein
MKIRKFNENKIEIIDLVYLFAEMSDDYLLSKGRQVDRAYKNRNIAIQTGDYFKSKPYIFTDLLEADDNDTDLKHVLNYLEQKKSFIILVQLDSDNKLDDSLHILNFVKNNYSQIEYFGFKLDNFFIAQEDVVQLKYISI